MITAVPAARMRHLTRLFAAVVVTGLSRYKSTRKILITVNAAVGQRHMKKSRINGATRCAFFPST